MTIRRISKMNLSEEQVKHLVAQVDKSVDTLAKVKRVRRALAGARYLPGTRKALTPEAHKIINDFLARKEKELSR